MATLEQATSMETLLLNYPLSLVKEGRSKCRSKKLIIINNERTEKPIRVWELLRRECYFAA